MFQLYPKLVRLTRPCTSGSYHCVPVQGKVVFYCVHGNVMLRSTLMSQAQLMITHAIPKHIYVYFLCISLGARVYLSLYWCCLQLSC